VVIFGSLLLIFAAIGLAVLGVVESSNALLIGSIVASLLAAVALVVGARQSTGGLLPDSGRERLDGRQPPRTASAAEPVPVAAGTTAPPAGQPLPDPSASRSTGGSTFISANAGFPVAAADAAPASPAPAQAGAPEPEHYEEPASASGPGLEPPVPVITTLGPRRDHDHDDLIDADAGYDITDDPEHEPVVEPVTRAQRARIAQHTDQVFVLDGRPRYHLSGCIHLLARDDSEPLPVNEAEELGFSPCSACAPLRTLLAR